MATVLLVIHVAICLALIVSVLLQRSEGGALGIGGGGGMMSGRGTANLMTRTTAILAAAFFITSIALTILARGPASTESKIDSIKVEGKKEPGKVIDSIAPVAPETKTEGPVVPKP